MLLQISVVSTLGSGRNLRPHGGFVLPRALLAPICEELESLDTWKSRRLLRILIDYWYHPWSITSRSTQAI